MAYMVKRRRKSTINPAKISKHTRRFRVLYDKEGNPIGESALIRVKNRMGMGGQHG